LVNSSFMSGDESVFNNTANNNLFIQNIQMSGKQKLKVLHKLKQAGK
jgi:hypothetical protein